jgi:hypothetical protein
MGTNGVNGSPTSKLPIPGTKDTGRSGDTAIKLMWVDQLSNDKIHPRNKYVSTNAIIQCGV